MAGNPGVESGVGASGAGNNEFLDPSIPPMPEGATARQRDEHWYKYVYKGDNMPQLTLRAVLMGGILGMLMSAANLYTTLTIGWSFGVAITSCVMSYVIWNAFRALTGGSISKMSILENNCMQSTAAAAGSSTGATIATMFGALLLLEPVPAGKTAADVTSLSISPWWIVASFTFGTACLGVFLAVPMKRQMINHEGLRFPSGVAAAETLRSLYSESAEALTKAYTLLVGLAVGLLIGLLNTSEGTFKFLDAISKATFKLPDEWQFPWNDWCEKNLWAGKAAGGHAGDFSILLIAAGVITRMRVCLSMFLGSCLLYFVVGPYLIKLDQAAALTGMTNGWVKDASGAMVYDAATFVKGTVQNVELGGGGTVMAFTRWALWGGTSLMVAASLAALAVNWRTVASSFSGFGKKDQAGVDNIARIEVPTKWMVIGLIPISIVLMIVQYYAFSIAWWAGLIAIAMSFVLAMVACRATGETDTTPIGAMGKVMQLTFAVLKPGQITPNLASAGVAANAASSAADLLTDLKSGYLLGANPRRQFLAQFFGVFFGTLAIVPAWFLMIPNKAALEKFALPATRQWAAVAEVLTQGLDKLPDSAKIAIVVGAVVGVFLVILERLSPPKVRPYLPSAMGLGLSWIVPFGNAFGFFVGAVIIMIWEKVSKRHATLFAIAIASGLIAGESLMKAILAMLNTANGIFGWGL